MYMLCYIGTHVFFGYRSCCCCCVRVSIECIKAEWAGKNRHASTYADPNRSSSSSNIESLLTKTMLNPTATTTINSYSSNSKNTKRYENNINHNFDGSNKEINTEYKKATTHTHTPIYIRTRGTRTHHTQHNIKMFGIYTIKTNRSSFGFVWKRRGIPM